MITIQETVFGTTPPENWQRTKLRYCLKTRRGNKNLGMLEDNLLSLSYGKIVKRDIEASEGLLPESFETYQIVHPGDIVMRLTDLQNDKRSIRQGIVREKGIVTSAYDAVLVRKGDDSNYWHYFLLALDISKYYYSLGGGVRQSIKFDDFPNSWVAVPSPLAQAAIAEYINTETDKIDKAIDHLGGSRSAVVANKSTLPSLYLERKLSLVVNVISGKIAIDKIGLLAKERIKAEPA